MPVDYKALAAPAEPRHPDQCGWCEDGWCEPCRGGCDQMACPDCGSGCRCPTHCDRCGTDHDTRTWCDDGSYG